MDDRYLSGIAWVLESLGSQKRVVGSNPTGVAGGWLVKVLLVLCH